MKKVLAALVLALLSSLVFAQVVVPTTAADQPDAFDKGVDEASINTEVTLNLPKATALHADVTNLTFDLTALQDGALQGDDIYCAYGLQEQDAKSQLGENFFNQVQTLPLGTSYNINANSWPNISINAGAEVTSYPPIQFDKNGELVPGSKNYFVCYKTFIIQKFSNFPYFKLTVDRMDEGGKGFIEHMYMQDNPCPADYATGLYQIDPLSSFELLPRAATEGTTGDRVLELPEKCGYKSWLDDVVVVAVKVNSDYYGESVAKLKFTLTSSDNPF